MTARDLIRWCETEPHWQREVNQFVDDFRRATREEREQRIAEAPERPGRFAGLVAAVVSVLCRDAHLPVPHWVEVTHSPEPFFAVTANGFALRVRLMLESPPAFRTRNVFVTEDYLRRA